MSNLLLKTRPLFASIILFFFGFFSLLIHNGYSIFLSINYNEWRIIEVLILVLISIYFYFNHKEISSYFSKTTILYKSIVIFIFFGLISAVTQAEYFSRALRDWSLYSSIIFAIIGLAFIIKSHPKLSKITLIVMCCAPIIFIIDFLYQILFYFIIPISPHHSVLQTWQAHFSNDRIYGDTTLPIVFMLAALISDTKNPRVKHFFLGLCFALSVMLMFSGGRGVIISCIVSITLGFLLNKTARKPLVYFSISLVFAFLMGLLLVYLLSGDLSQGTVLRGDSSGRIFIIKQAFDDFSSSPLFGIGPAQFSLMFNQVPLSHPHNIFLQILIEWGFFAFLAFFTILFMLFIRLLQYIKNEENIFNFFIFLGSVSFLINCNFNGAHIYPSSQIYGLFIIAWLFSIYITPTTNTESNPKNFVINYVLPCVVLSTSLVLVTTTYIALGCSGNNAPTEATYGGPRFWQADSAHDDAVCKPFSEINFSFKSGK